MDVHCPDCKVKMVPGRRADRKDSFSTSQEAWIPGDHELESLGWFQNANESVPVVTFACPKCGFLRSYVDKDHIPHNLD